MITVCAAYAILGTSKVSAAAETKYTEVKVQENDTLWNLIDTYNPNANITIPSGGAFQMTLTDTYTNALGKKVSSSININYQTANENCTSKLEQQLQNLKFNPNFTNTLTFAINPLVIQPLYKVISNGICVPNNITQNNGLMDYTFTVTQNSFYSPGASSYTQASSFGNGANGRTDT
jgi:hypothetical protein